MLSNPGFQVLINVGQTLKSTGVAPNIAEQNDALKRALASGPRIGVPVNPAPAERWPIPMARRPETTTINIDHQLVQYLSIH